MAECGRWQCGCGGAADVLHAVFAWLEGEELSRVAAVCRAWREAANAPALWRAALARRAGMPPAQLRRLASHRRGRGEASGFEQPPGAESDAAERRAEAAWWRDEFALAAAGWRARGRHALGAGAALLHAALAEQTQGHPKDGLALAAEDATLTVWISLDDEEGSGNEGWRLAWRDDAAARGWRSAARVQWAPPAGGGCAPRLLAAGPLALADRWEVTLFQFDDEWRGRAMCRAASSAGGGAWAGADAFVTTELQRVAPMCGVTTVWLNAAHQAEQSEFAGVTAPLLRVYNEAQAHIS
ncbi:uncharacterized protein LOC113237149 [Hyposmocoma kahamanoa]|uniref:uncharacterized protein LOC113237149 n=1 Tax=Hyposmocoma kahamanoa TaxID=1477025 RepID=UPI000E6D624F|nr:uncharacterized protein LOC113237149 [Hyposmocoma kahamanoa]